MKTIHNYTKSIKKGKYSVVDCKTCGYWHIYPKPSIKKLYAYYEKKYYHNLKKNPTMSDKLHDPEGFYSIQYRDRLRNINKVFPENEIKTMLDIGAGYGDFMRFMKKNGWNVRGIEPSHNACGIKNDKELQIDCMPVEEIEKKHLKKVSLVTINNVLEHLRDPKNIITLVKNKLLADKGILYVIVPNDFNVLQTMLMKSLYKHNIKKQYYWIAPLDHLNYWSIQSIQNFLKSCGFKIVSVMTDFPMELFPFLGFDYVQNPQIGRKAHLKRVQFEKIFEKHKLNYFKDDLFKMFRDKGMGRDVHICATPC